MAAYSLVMCWVKHDLGCLCLEPFLDMVDGQVIVIPLNPMLISQRIEVPVHALDNLTLIAHSTVLSVMSVLAKGGGVLVWAHVHVWRKYTQQLGDRCIGAVSPLGFAIAVVDVAVSTEQTGGGLPHIGEEVRGAPPERQGAGGYRQMRICCISKHVSSRPVGSNPAVAHLIEAQLTPALSYHERILGDVSISVQ